MSMIRNRFCLYMGAVCLLSAGCDRALDEIGGQNVDPTSGANDRGTESDDASAMLTGSSFQILGVPFCGYTEDLSALGDEFSVLSLSQETDDAFELKNNSVIDERSVCAIDGSEFECDDIIVITMAVDGIDLESGEDTWATIEYSLELSGTIGPDGIQDIDAVGAVNCKGSLCNEENCESDISDAVIWQPASNE